MRNKSDNAHEVLDIMWNKVQGRYQVTENCGNGYSTREHGPPVFSLFTHVYVPTCTLSCFVTCPLCELKLAEPATGIWLCFIGSSPGVCYKTLSPILFHFSLVLLIYLNQNRNVHSRTPNDNNSKRFKKKSKHLLFSPTLIFWPLLQILPL